MSGSQTDSPSTLALTVQNERGSPAEITITVRDEAAAVVLEETDRLGANTSRTFEFTAPEQNRYTVTIDGDEWKTEQAWDADACASAKATVTFDGSVVSHDGDCVQSR